MASCAQTGILTKLASKGELPTPIVESGSVETATYPPLMGIVATVAALYFGRAIFLPLATAVLLTFALAPLVRRYANCACHGQSRW